jgi:hypothetical protein
MKTRVILCLALLLVLMPFMSASATPALPPGVTYNGASVWTVYPHNSSPDDPDRIQAVVDLAAPGDTVRLAAGTFDFSEFETVRIAKDLTLEGAWDKKNQVPLTTIKHGYMPVLIGRKTPVEKPFTEMINGHAVYHLTMDVWGKLVFAFAYPGMEDYNIFDYWTPVHVNVRQIAFERPYGAAIFSSGMDGGTIEKVRIESAWPWQIDYEGGGTGSMGIGWYNTAVLPMAVAEWGRFYDQDLYTGTDLIRGDLFVQDSVILGDERSFMEGNVDEAGDLVAVAYDASSPVPPKADYDKYVLQDVAFEWDSTGLPIPGSIQPYWVKKGYTAASYGGQVWAERGIWAGVYSLYAQSNLTVRRNVIQDCGVGAYFLENGFRGVPFTALVEDNQITPAISANWATGFNAVGWEHYNPFTGELYHADPGMFIAVRDNTITTRNENLNWWDTVVNVSMYGEALVEKNQIDLASGSGIVLGWPTQSAAVLNNRISGAGDYALMTWWGSNGNLLKANNLHAFVPTGLGCTDVGVPPAEILLISDNNAVIGGGHHEPGETVWDLGNNNTVTGMTRRIGQHLTEEQWNAIAKANQMKKTLP